MILSPIVKITECIYDTQGVRGKISEICKAVNLLISHENSVLGVDNDNNEIRILSFFSTQSLTHNTRRHVVHNYIIIHNT